MKNRLCAWFLAVCLLLGVMPPGVRATDVSLSDAEASEEDNADASGDTAALESVWATVTAEIIASKGSGSGTGVNTVSGEFRHNRNTDSVQQTTAETLDAVKQGESGGLTWVLDTNGVLTISGAGPMADYSGDSPAPWNADRESVGQVVIENGVTSIGDDAFTDCNAMSSISVPDTVTSIGKFAFLNCYSLQSVEIPQNVTKIGEQAFYYCSALSGVSVPAGVAKIGDGVFSGCANLSAITVASGNSAYVSDNGVLFNSAKTRLINYPAGKTDTAYSIPESVTEIGFGAFEACENLTSVTIPDGVRWIELQTFTFCANLKSVDIPASVTEIGQYAFQDCAALTDVYYGGTETQWNAVKIGEDNEPLNKATIHYNSGGGTSSDILAQGYCGGEGDGTNLSYVLTQDGTLTISGTGKMATYNDRQSRPPWYERRANITKLVVENGVTSIGAFTFHGCNALTSAAIPDSVTLIDTYAFYGCVSLNDVAIPSNVTNIGAYAFENCRLSPSVTIPASVVSIGEGVFAHCGELTDVYVSSGNSAYVSENGILFNSSKTALVCYPAGKSATAYVIPSNVTSIVGSAFAGCKGLNSVTIPDGVSSISGYAFNLCDGLTSVTIPASVTAVNYGAFNGCNSLADVYYGGTATQWATLKDNIDEAGNEPLLNATIHYNSGGGTSSDILAQGYCGGEGDGTNLSYVLTKDGTLTISGSGKMADYAAESYVPWYNDRKTITTLIIKNGVTSIGDCAFSHCNNLPDVTIPDSVISIGRSAFFNINALKRVTIPNSVTSIGNGAFYGCNSLPNVTIPDSVTSIGSEAFASCWKLTNVDVASANTAYSSVNGVLFNKDKSVLICYPAGKPETTYVIPDSVTSIEEFAFEESEHLESVTIPDSATSIGYSAFFSCDGLKSVRFPDGVTEIHGQMFTYCRALESVTIPASVTSIGGRAFEECNALKDVYYGGTEAQWATLKGNVGESNDPLLNATIHFASPNAYTVTYYVAQGADAEPYQTVTVRAGETYTLMDKPPVQGPVGGAAWEIQAWSVNGQRHNFGDTITINADTTVRAVWYYYSNHYINIWLNGDGSVLDKGEWGGSAAPVISTNKIPVKAEDDEFTYKFREWDSGTRDKTTAFQSDGEVSTITTVYAPIFDAVPKLSDDIIAQGACGAESGGANLSWSLTRGGLLRISGSGAMADYSASAPWYANRQGVKKAVIESVGSGVSSIGADSFRDCSALQSVTIPDTVSYIGAYAFAGCDALTNVSYNGTQDQWETVTLSSGNDALEFADVQCGDVAYNPFRALEPFPRHMGTFGEQKWLLAAPVEKFEDLSIDGTSLERGKEYVAENENGHTRLTIPEATFATFEEGSHNITATFRVKSKSGGDETRTTSAVYTIFPDGDAIKIDDSEVKGQNAVQGVSYPYRFQTQAYLKSGKTVKLSDRFYQMEILDDAKLNGQPLNIETGDASALGARRTSEEEEHAGDSVVQRLGNQNFYFHKNGRFSGVPTQPGEYTFKVRLRTRNEPDIPWDDAKLSDEISVTLVVEKITEETLEQNKDKVEEGNSAGYSIEERASSDTGQPLEEGDAFHMSVSHDADDEFADFYVDGVKQIRHVDYEVYRIDPGTGKMIRLFEAGELTNTYIQSRNTTLSAGVHSLNLEFKHVDSLENTQTRKVSQVVSVKEKTEKVNTPVKMNYSSGSGSGSSSGSSSTTYSIKATKAAHGTISLSAAKIAAGKSVTITVTPDKGYYTEKVSVIDSKKNAVETKRDGNKYAFTMPKRAVTVSASFALSTYSVTVSQSQHGKVSLNRSSAAPGVSVNGTTTPDKGYLLSGVTVRDADGKSVKVETFNDGKFTFLMPSGKTTLSATFTVKRLASFVDIQGPDWFFDDAEWAYDRNILRGTTEQYWEPQSLMNSITSIVTLERLDGVDLTPYDTGADDGLDNNAWYVSALRWANANHITLSDRPFGGQDALTRGEFALMLANYLRYRGITTSAPDDLTFTDAAMMSADELNAFLILQKADVFRGYSDGSIRPKAYLSRAHLSALLHRLSSYIIQIETDN